MELGYVFLLWIRFLVQNRSPLYWILKSPDWRCPGWRTNWHWFPAISTNSPKTNRTRVSAVLSSLSSLSSLLKSFIWLSTFGDKGWTFSALSDTSWYAYNGSVSSSDTTEQKQEDGVLFIFLVKKQYTRVPLAILLKHISGFKTVVTFRHSEQK